MFFSSIFFANSYLFQLKKLPYLLFLFSFPLLLSAQITDKKQLSAQAIIENEARAISKERAKTAEENYRKLRTQVEEISKYRIALEQELASIKKKDFIPKLELRNTKQQINEAKQEEELLKEATKEAEKWAKLSVKMIAMSKKKRDKVLVKLGKEEWGTNVLSSETLTERKIPTVSNENMPLEEQRLRQHLQTEEQAVNSLPSPQMIKEEEQPSDLQNDPFGAVEKNTVNTPPKVNLRGGENNTQKVFQPYDIQKDVYFHPLPPKCEIAYEGKDEFTGQIRKDVAQDILFTHTDERLRAYLQDKEYLTGEAYLTSLSNGYHFITIHFTIASKNARLEYGKIDKGGLLSILFLDGKSITLRSSKTAEGTYDPYQETYVYKTQYPLNGKDVKQLREKEIDKVRVTWSSGYEIYEVYNVDFFIDQFACLNKK